MIFHSVVTLHRVRKICNSLIFTRKKIVVILHYIRKICNGLIFTRKKIVK
jgi:hypothetical protein